MRKKTFYTGIAAQFVIVLAVFYFSWIPNPVLSENKVLSSSILKWADTYFNLRTALPFFLLSLLGFPILSLKNPFFALKLNFSMSLLLVLSAEIGQLFLHDRHFDFKDIIYGLFGSYIGFTLRYYLFRYRKSQIFYS